MRSPDRITSIQSRHGVVGQLLDQSLARGRFVVSVEELVKSSQLTSLAVKRQLDRLGPRVARLPGSGAVYLLIPPEHQLRGSPPVAAWLDNYFKRRGQRYYVGLLSAAVMYGSSKQAVQTTQIIVAKPTRPFDLGRVHVDFFVKSHLELTPFAELPGLPAPLAISTPEATAIDLIVFGHAIGGIARAAEVIDGMRKSMTAAGMRQALASESRNPVKQRLGYVLEVLGMEKLVPAVWHSIHSEAKSIMLQTHTVGAPARGTTPSRWKVIDNIGLAATRK